MQLLRGRKVLKSSAVFSEDGNCGMTIYQFRVQRLLIGDILRQFGTWVITTSRQAQITNQAVQLKFYNKTFFGKYLSLPK